ncbi:MAG TPA: cell division protein ZapA [Puia sp.]|nr:cell division protein ZapA [Puia sp.]
MQELIPINVLIGDRTYRVKIQPKDEEVIRKTLKVINDQIIEFKGQFSGKDMQDYVAMVLLWYATQLPSMTEQHSSPDKDILETLRKMEDQLDQTLR